MSSATWGSCFVGGVKANAQTSRKRHTGATARFDLCKIRIFHDGDAVDVCFCVFSGLEGVAGRRMGSTLQRAVAGGSRVAYAVCSPSSPITTAFPRLFMFNIITFRQNFPRIECRPFPPDASRTRLVATRRVPPSIILDASHDEQPLLYPQLRRLRWASAKLRHPRATKKTNSFSLCPPAPLSAPSRPLAEPARKPRFVYCCRVSEHDHKSDFFQPKADSDGESEEEVEKPVKKKSKAKEKGKAVKPPVRSSPPSRVHSPAEHVVTSLLRSLRFLH